MLYVTANDSYLRVKYGVLWTDLRNLDAPLRVGDVVILPGKLVDGKGGKKLITSNGFLAWCRQLRFPNA